MDARFSPAKPKMSFDVGTGEWSITWSRKPEAALILSHFNGRARDRAIISVSNMDQVSINNTNQEMARLSPYTVISLTERIVNTVLLPMIFGASYILEREAIPLSLGKLLASTSYSESDIKRLPSSDLRVVMNKVMATSNLKPNSLIEVSDALGLRISRLDGSEFDALEPISPSRAQRSTAGAIAEDYARDPHFKEFIERSIFAIVSSSELLRREIISYGLEELKVVTYRRGLVGDIGFTIGSDDSSNLAASVLTVSESMELIKPALGLPDDEMARSEMFVKLLLTEKAAERTDPNSEGRYLNEITLIQSIQAIRKAMNDQQLPFALSQKTSPVRAEVQNEQLNLINSGLPKSNTNELLLDALRSRYHAEAQRLQSLLSSTNGAAPFAHRLAEVGKSLAMPFDEVSSLILADQARGLEVMLPSMEEVLIEVNASDVAAFVGGLGLLTRQFSVWQDFLNEAQSGFKLSHGDDDNIKKLAGILREQPDEVVSPDLKEAIAQTESAREGLIDPILDLAFVRAIGNAFRAVAQYAHDRAVGIGKQINESFDKEIANVVVKAPLAALLGSATGALLHLSTGLPLEFGWIIALHLYLTKQR